MTACPKKVVLDTDIGDDIDDTWALAMMLKSPEIDLQLAVSCTGDTLYRAELLGRFLERANRTDVPIGVGLRDASWPLGSQAPWVEDYQLDHYPGTVCDDGVDAIIRTIMDSPEPVTLLCIGPLTNIAEVLRREPAIPGRTRLVGMLGSVYRGYGDHPEPAAEYNIKIDVPAAQAVFAAPWQSATITPLDTCGTATLNSEQVRRLNSSDDALVNMVLENHRLWWGRKKNPDTPETWTDQMPRKPLFDTVAVHLTHSRAWLEFESIALKVSDAGFTAPDDSGRVMEVAVRWADRTAFLNDLVARLLPGPRHQP